MWWRLRPIFVPLGAAIRAPDDVIVSGFDSRIFHPRERGRLYRRTYDLRRLASIQTTEEDEDHCPFVSAAIRLVGFTPGDDQRPSLVSV